jgi:Xaa-Pro aminopeptidase
MREQLPRVTWVPADDLLWRIRAVKTPEEIARLREAFRIGTQVYHETFAMMRPGVRLADVQRMQMARTSELGGTWYFNHLWVHAPGTPWDPPPEYALREGDEGGCDLGVYVKGYGCDFGRTVSLGRVDPDVRRQYETLRAGYEAMAGAARAGNSTRDVMRAAVTVERDLRGGRILGCRGHGLGLECHEMPVLMHNWDEPLEENMVLQVEVGDVIDGRNTFLFLEDAGVITAQGWQCLTDLPREIFELG